MAKKTSAWVKHVTSTYKEMKKRNRNAKLGDAMKAAKKTYKKPKTSGGGSTLKTRRRTARKSSRKNRRTRRR